MSKELMVFCFVVWFLCGISAALWEWRLEERRERTINEMEEAVENEGG